MKKIHRTASGALLGGALVLAAGALAPQQLLAQTTGYCEQVEGRTICYTVDEKGRILTAILVE